jgi:hypothetical protein
MAVAEQPAIIVQMMNGAGGCWGVTTSSAVDPRASTSCDGACEPSDTDGDQPSGRSSTESGSGGGLDGTADLGILSRIERDPDEPA